MAKTSKQKLEKPEILGGVRELPGAPFTITDADVIYYDSSTLPDVFDDIWDRTKPFRPNQGDSIAIRLRLSIKRDEMRCSFKLTFKLAGEDSIVLKTFEDTAYFFENEPIAIRFHTGVLPAGEYFVGIHFRNYLLQIIKFELYDPFSPEAMAPIDETPGLDDLKQFLRKQINLLNYTDAIITPFGKTPISINWNMVFCGAQGTGKERMVKLIADLLYELDVCKVSYVNTVDGHDLAMKMAAGTNIISSEFRFSKNEVLFIRNADLLLKRQRNNPVPLGNMLQELVDKVKSHNMVLILSGNSSEMLGILSMSEELGRLVPNRFKFDDMTTDTLMEIAEQTLEKRYMWLSNKAKETFRALITATHNSNGKKFKNADWLLDIIEQDIIPRMANRVVETHLLNDAYYSTRILPEDIPQFEPDNKNKSFDKLNGMIGLSEMKENLTKHLFQVSFNQRRNQLGLYGKMGPLHMIFTGNPGTGKTTVAVLIGEIYRNMGILSSGHVVQMDRSKLVGEYIGQTEANTLHVIESAQGGILFIDEAYALFDGNSDRDFGRHVISALLPVLSDDEADLIVIFAGYPKEMDKLMKSNPGLQSRFPHVFHFSDYTFDELMQIADYAANERDFVFSPEARKALENKVSSDLHKRDANFGNARYVIRLLQTQIIPNMSARLAKYHGELDVNMLKTILPEDIPAISYPEKETVNAVAFDEQAIDNALQRLDSMIGLSRVKMAVHNFVKASRSLNRQSKTLAGRIPLKWSFTGATGTGKSTVAGIFAEILRAMHLLEKGHLVEVNAEEIFGVTPYQVEERLKSAMVRSQQGLLFIDGDSMRFRQEKSGWDSEQLRMMLAGYATEMSGAYALVIAEYESPRQHLVKNLDESGVTEFDQTFIFDNYTVDELMQILSQMLLLEDMSMNDEAAAVMRSYIEGLSRNPQEDYANANTMKLLATSIVQRTRVRAFDASEPATTVTVEDVKGYVWKDLPAKHRKIGYRSN